MEQETIKVVVKRPLEKGIITTINNTNEAYREVIGAEHIDYILFKDSFNGNPIDCIIDDFGLKKKLAINFNLNCYDIHGTVIFVERDSEGEFIDLSEESLEYLEFVGML